MASVLGQPWMFRYEPEEVAVGGMKATERHVLQAVEVVLGRVLGELKVRNKRKERKIRGLANRRIPFGSFSIRTSSSLFAACMVSSPDFSE